MFTRYLRWRIAEAVVATAMCCCLIIFSGSEVEAVEPGLTEVNLNQLYRGMTLWKVETLLGRQQKIDRGGIDRGYDMFDAWWQSDEISAKLYFYGPTGDERLIAAFMFRHNRPISSSIEEVELREAPFARFRHWLGR